MASFRVADYLENYLTDRTKKRRVECEVGKNSQSSRMSKEFYNQ